MSRELTPSVVSFGITGEDSTVGVCVQVRAKIALTADPPRPRHAEGEDLSVPKVGGRLERKTALGPQRG